MPRRDTCCKNSTQRGIDQDGHLQPPHPCVDVGRIMISRRNRRCAAVQWEREKQEAQRNSCGQDRRAPGARNICAPESTQQKTQGASVGFGPVTLDASQHRRVERFMHPV